MIVVVNLKKNRIEQDYVDNLNKNIIVIPNKEDLYSLEYDNLGTNSIVDSNFKYALLGHKDYRSTLTNGIINNQIKEALNLGITVILCVNSIDMLKQDLKGITDYKNIIVAYEVDSYIGTDKTVPVNEIEDFIKEVKTISKDLRVIYGGGIRLDTVNDIIKIKDLYGILIGREYINIDKYMEVI